MLILFEKVWDVGQVTEGVQNPSFCEGQLFQHHFPLA
jgi:hypothetical protein